ncbi:MAG: hypothetical protein EOP45_03060, partial [Sphingobacteriaceae bacterium]
MNFNFFYFKINLKPFALGAIVLCSIGVSAQTTQKGLKDYYRKYFPIGVAVSTRSFQGKEGKLILSQFNSITPENSMKMGPIHPEENRYNWK